MSEKKGTTIERLALSPVPKDERQHWISVTLIQAGFMISATSLWTGSIMIDGLSLIDVYKRQVEACKNTGISK